MTYFGLQLRQSKRGFYVQRVTWERFPFSDSPIIAMNAERVSPFLPGVESARGFAIDYCAQSPGKCLTGEQAEQLMPKRPRQKVGAIA